MESTLPASIPVTKDIPIISSRGGTEQAYKDPNSPESIIKKSKEMEVQAVEDSKFDVNVPAYDSKEGYLDLYEGKRKIIIPTWIILFIILVLVIFRKEIQNNNILIIGVIGGIFLLYILGILKR